VVVVSTPSAGSHFREKHLSGVRFEPIAIATSSRRPRRLFEWITTAWQGTLAQKNGAVIRVDVNGRPQAKREFVKAILVETTVPMLDGASNSTADFTVHFAPEHATDNPATFGQSDPRRRSIHVVEFPTQYRRPRLHPSLQDRFVLGEANSRNRPCRISEPSDRTL
jgi:hypothetical protein